MHRALGRGHGVPIQHQRRNNWPLFREVLTPCIYRQGHNTTAWRLLQTYLIRVQGGLQGPERSGKCIGPSAEGMVSRFLTRGGVIGPCFVNFDPLCVSPRAQPTGRRLFQTDMARMNCDSQGPGWCPRCAGRSVLGTGNRFFTRGGVVGSYFVDFGPLWALPRAQYDGTASAANVPGTCTRWSPGPRMVWQMPWPSVEGTGCSSPTRGGVTGPCFVNF
jgi:hypothetical protein